MEAVHFFRRLYSLDTLDTRLTTSSHTPLTVVTEESSEKATSKRGVETNAANLPPGASPSKWWTPEFYFYYAVFILVVPQMFRSVMNVSRRRYHRCGEYIMPDLLQHHIPTTQGSRTCSPLDGYEVAKSCVKVQPKIQWRPLTDIPVAVGQFRLPVFQLSRKHTLYGNCGAATTLAQTHLQCSNFCTERDFTRTICSKARDHKRRRSWFGRAPLHPTNVLRPLLWTGISGSVARLFNAQNTSDTVH